MTGQQKASADWAAKLGASLRQPPQPPVNAAPTPGPAFAVPPPAKPVPAKTPGWSMAPAGETSSHRSAPQAAEAPARPSAAGVHPAGLLGLLESGPAVPAASIPAARPPFNGDDSPLLQVLTHPQGNRARSARSAASPAPTTAPEPDKAIAEPPKPSIPAAAKPAEAADPPRIEPELPGTNPTQEAPKQVWATQTAPAQTAAVEPAALEPAGEPGAKPAAASKPPITEAVSEPSGHPLAAAAIAAAYSRIKQKPHSDPAALAASELGPDWVALAESLGSAKGSWRALFFGAGLLDLPGAALQAGRRAGLDPHLQVTEAAAGRADKLRGMLDADALAKGEVEILVSAVSANPAALEPSARLAQDLLRQASPWDLVRVGVRGMLRHLINLDTPLLTERVRWLMLAPQSRIEEATAIRLLLAADWKLVAERPALLRLDQPNSAERLGAQLWRGPLA